LVVSILARRSPSTRFPYTTLFRSAAATRLRVDVRIVGDRRQALRRAVAVEHGQAAERHPRFKDRLVARLSARDVEPQRAELRAPDRKSTRLNSSHQIISYAVFCLN